MIHPIPSGTRDVLPDETREVRAITDALRGRVRGATATARSTRRRSSTSRCSPAPRLAEAQPAYRVFDESGAVLVLRSDMTVPIARVVATRYATASRRCASATSRTATAACARQRGQPRELLQAGIELIGAPAPEGTAEALTVLCRALDATGLKDYRVGLGDASLFPALMASLQRARGRAAHGLLEALVARDFVELEHAHRATSGLAGEAAELLLDVPQRRGGPELLADAPEPAGGGDRAAPGARAARAATSPRG